MSTNTINTSNDIYLIEFQNSVAKKFIVTYDKINEPLRLLKEGYYLANIYRFNNSKLKFERVPKNMYDTLFGWNTEAIQLLKNK